MKTVPMQLVVVELENGRRGVFFGSPLLTESDDFEESEVTNVWFSSVNSLPDDADLEQLSLMALEHFRNRAKPLH